MIVKFLTSVAGSYYSYKPGDVGPLEDDEAVRFIAAGYAVPVREAAAVSIPEKAVASAPVRKAVRNVRSS